MASEGCAGVKTERSGWIQFDSIRFRFDSNRLESTRLRFPRTRLPMVGGGRQDVVGASPCRGGEALWVGPFGFFGWR